MPRSFSASPAGSPPTRRWSWSAWPPAPATPCACPDPGQPAVRRPGHLRGRDRRAGAVDEFERDPARGAYPGEPGPEHDPISHLELVRRAELFASHPRRQHVAKLARPGRQPAHQRGAGLHRPAGGGARDERPMYEHPATRDNLEPARARGRRSSSPARAGWPRGRVGVGRLAEPAEDPRAVEWLLARQGRARWTAARARHRRRNPRADRLGALRGQPLLRPHGAGARRRGRTARRQVTLIAANVALPGPTGVECRRRDGGRAEAAAEASSPAPTCC